MKSVMQHAWLRRAGALAAGSLVLGAPKAAMAEGWASHVSTASSVPVQSARQTYQNAFARPDVTARPWFTPSTVPADLSSQRAALPAFNSAAMAAAGQINPHISTWQGQQFLTRLPVGNNYSHAPINFAQMPTLGGQGMSFDLSSTGASIVLGTSLFRGNESVTINVGGTNQTFSAGAQVTAAEYVAIRQVLAGAQTLTLDASGAASGGTFNIGATAARISDLVVPSGVTAFNYATTGRPQVITGDVTNYGTIYGVGMKGLGNNVSINAQDITNQNGALISTKLPSDLVTSLGSMMTGVNLSLTAVDNISNAGQILSSGNLTLTSQMGSIYNVAGPSQTAPIMQAIGTVALNTGSGNLTNSGAIVSNTGSININTAAMTNNLNINATGGSFQAQKGDINLRDGSYKGSANINLEGGDYLSQNLNAYAGTGTIIGAVGELTGTLNTSAAADHLQVSTETLKLGNNIISGDPTFVNTQGGIQIVGRNEFNEDVSIIAKNGISASVDGRIIASGHNVTLVSGAKITTTNAIDSSTVPGAAATQTVTVDPAAGDGIPSNIDLTASKIGNIIDTSSTTGNAGNISLVAYNGNIYVAGNSTLKATATGSNNGGNITVIGNGSEQTAIKLGNVMTGGGVAGGKGGDILISSSMPTTSDGKSVTFDTTGAITSGNKFVPGTLNSSAFIQINGDLVTAPLGQTGVTAGTKGASAGAITVSAGNGILAKNILAFGGGGAGGDSASMAGGAGGNGGAIILTTENSGIGIAGQINSSGGGGGGAGSNGIAGAAGGIGGNAGAIVVSMTTSAPINISGGIYAAQGGNGGTSNMLGVGGGGASYGGGGGGGASATAGGAGGAGYAGGGGAILNASGAGGGYTGGASGGTSANAGGYSYGGNGIGDTGTSTVSKGGSLAGLQQGGAGVLTGANGDNIPTTAGGNSVTITGTQLIAISGDIVGSKVSVTAPIGIKLLSNVIGTQSVAISANTGSITLNTATLKVLTPDLTFNVGATAAVNIGGNTVPINSNASKITLTGKAAAVFITDSAASTILDSTGLTSISTLNLQMSAASAFLDVKALPTGITTLVLNVGADAATGGTINFLQNGVTLVQDPVFLTAPSAVITAKNLTWTNAASSPFALKVDNAAGNAGTISLTTSQVNSSSNIALGNGAGQLILSATGGNIATVGGSISLIAPSANLSIDAAANPLQVGFTGAPTSAKGGIINLNVLTLTEAKGNLLTLDASGVGNSNGLGGGNGGTITVTTNTSTAQSIGTGSGSIRLIAKNGGGTGNQVGGSVSFLNSGTGSLTVDQFGLVVMDKASTNLGGGSITLKSGTIANATAGPLTLNVDGLGTGNGGRLSITETANGTGSTRLLGSGGDFDLSAQGGLTGGNGGVITYVTQGKLLLQTDSAGNVVGTSVKLAPQFTTGSGGQLTLGAFTFANSDTNNKSPLTFNVSGVGAGNGGLIKVTQFDSATDLSIGKNAGDMQFIATNGPTGLTGGLVIATLANPTFTGTGKLVIDPAAISIMTSSKTNPNVNGGLIQLSGPRIVAASTVSSKVPLTLNVSAIGNAVGGTIIFEESNGDSTTVVGNKAGQFQLLATGGRTGGNGGSVTVISGGNLTVNPIGLSVKPGTNGNGGRITLSATNNLSKFDGSEGNLLVTAALNANGVGKGKGGSIGLSSNSSTVFNVGLTTNNTNGVKGALSVTGIGGSVNITANKAGITIQSAMSTPENITLNLGAVAVGDITINSTVGGTKTNNITIAPVGAATGIATNIIGGNTGKLVTSTSGQITLRAINDIRGLITISKTATTTKQLQIVTTQISATTSKGDIDVISGISSRSFLTVNEMNAGNDTNLSSNGGIKTKGHDPDIDGGVAITSGGNTNVIAKGPIDASMTGNKIAVKSTLSVVKSGFDALANDGLTVNTPASAFAVTPMNDHTMGRLELTYDSSSILISASSGVAITGFIGKTQTNVTIQNNQANSPITGDAIVTGKTVFIQTQNGDVGSSAPNGAFSVTSPALTINTGLVGNVFIANNAKTVLGVTNSTAGSYVINSAGGATLTGVTSNDGNVDLTTHGVTILNDIHSTGEITVLAGGASTVGNLSATGLGGAISIKTSTGLLQTAIDSKITAQNGGIHLEHTNVKTGTITIGSGSDLETGISPSSGTGGDITITIGDVPVIPVTGTAPAIAEGKEIGTGKIYWGQNSISGSNKNGMNTITAKNANVIFSTGTLRNTAIKLNGNTTLIADPPGSLTGGTELTVTTLRDGEISIPVNRLTPTGASIDLPAALVPTNITEASNLATLTEDNLIVSATRQFDQSLVAKTHFLLDQGTGGNNSSELDTGLIPATFIRRLGPGHPISISNASLLIAAEYPTIIQTPFGTLTMAAHSLALLLINEDAISIFNFDDQRSNSVRLKTSINQYSLSPGDHLLITRDTGCTFETANMTNLIPFRNVKRTEYFCQNQSREIVFQAVFHVPHALGSVLPLRELILAKDKDLQKIAKHLLKTSCILSETYLKGQAFRQILKPKLLATCI